MLINDLNGGHPYMQHQVAGKVLRLLPVWFTVLLLVQLLLLRGSGSRQDGMRENANNQ